MESKSQRRWSRNYKSVLCFIVSFVGCYIAKFHLSFHCKVVRIAWYVVDFGDIFIKLKTMKVFRFHQVRLHFAIVLFVLKTSRCLGVCCLDSNFPKKKIMQNWKWNAPTHPERWREWQSRQNEKIKKMGKSRILWKALSITTVESHCCGNYNKMIELLTELSTEILNVLHTAYNISALPINQI